MKNLIVVLIGVLVLTACSSKQEDKKVLVTASTANVVSPSPKLDFSDPARIAGSNFGEFFISMIRTQNYDMALRFTSKESIEKFGVAKILDKYENFKFNYKLTQKSVSTDLENPDNIIIAYATNEYATGKIKKITITVENDSCKLVLPDTIDDLLK